MRLSDTLSSVGGSATMATNAWTTSHADPIALSMGEPTVPPPEPIRIAIERAMLDGRTGYGPPAGLPELREALAVDRGIDPSSVVVTPGGKPALAAALRCLLDPGDEVIILAPFWPSARDQVLWARGVPVIVAHDDEAAIEAAFGPRTRAVILNSPNNPTSQILPRAELERWVERAHRQDTWIVSDEVYRELAWNDAGSPADVDGGAERTIVITSFSKRFAMTGYRLGALFAPPALVDAVVRWNSTFVTHAATPIQYGGIAALTEATAWAEAQRDEYQRAAEWLGPRLDALAGVRCAATNAGFYFWLQLDPSVLGAGEPRRSSLDVARSLLEREGLRLVPSEAFGVEGALRLAYPIARPRLEEAVTRLERFFSATLDVGENRED